MSVKSTLEDLAENISKQDDRAFQFYERIAIDETIKLRRQDFETDDDYSFACEIFEAQRRIGRAAYILRKKSLN